MSVVQDLKNFSLRFNNTPKEKILNVMVSYCVHRQIDPQIFYQMNILQVCPNPKISIHIQHGDALIERSRNRVATKFLEMKEFDILFFIDDDIIFNPQEVAKISKLMISENLDICGAAYVLKREGKTNFAFKPLDSNKMVFGKNGVIQEIMYLSTGFFAIQRKVLEAMKNQKNDKEESIFPLCFANEEFRFYPFFRTMDKILDGQWISLSEDWSFCERAKQLGFKVWLDTTVQLGHIGKKVYGWNDMIKNAEKSPDIISDNFEYVDKDGIAYIKRI